MIIVGIVAVVALCFFYFNGYTVSTNGLHAPGRVTINVPNTGTLLYIDGSKKKTTKKDGQTLNYNLPAREHTFVLSKDGFWPWQKEIALKSRDNIVLNPFFISKTLSGSSITVADPEYRNIKGKISAAKLPEVTSRRLSADNKVTVWLDGNMLLASWHGSAESAPAYLCQAGSCTDAVKIFMFNTVPTSLEFYKDRNDVLLVGVGDTIGALELDIRDTQNFQPVYQGGTPRFVKSETGSLYVDDGKSLSEINL
jgi:hypothetical protein